MAARLLLLEWPTARVVCSRSRWANNGFKQLSSAPVCQSAERYIQESKVPTLHFQPSLLRLPIPKLEATCNRYLAAQKPILNDADYSATEALVREFSKEDSDGYELNKRLIRQDQENKHTSYISEYWFDMYLKDRRSVVLNQNPFIVFKNDQRQPTQVDRAVNFIRSIIRFRNALMDNKLEPEIFHLNPARSDTEWFKNIIRFVPSSLSCYGAYLLKAFPLDMSQYRRLFNSTRIPRPGKDELKSFPDRPHVLVMRNGHMYCVEASQSDGLPVDPHQLFGSLTAILGDSTTPAEWPLGYLTTLGREEWALARQELAADPKNAAVLEKIDSALFVLCMDDSEPNDPFQATTVFLHNYGFNRWFDKSFQLIVCRNAVSAFNFEHAWGDGVAVLRLFNELFKETTTRPVLPHEPSSSPLPEKLQPVLSDNLKAAISKAKGEVEMRTQSLRTNVLQYGRFAKSLLKTKSLSADGIMQLAFQIAYYRQYKYSPATYESCSTAAFKHGRTETLRPATVATRKCAVAFEPSSGVSLQEKGGLVKEAVKWHSKLVKEAAMGQGFDRHLFALKCLAASEKLSFPLFEDPAYEKLNHIILSTSTLSADSVWMGGFAPVTPDGYGVGYAALDDSLRCNIATYPTRDGQQFVANVECVLNDLYDVLQVM